MGRRDECRRSRGQPKGEVVDGEFPPSLQHDSAPPAPQPLGAQMGVQTRQKNPHMDAVQSSPRGSRCHTTL
eukprot:2818262-Pyramimonas_sp.AAC.1